MQVAAKVRVCPAFVFGLDSLLGFGHLQGRWCVRAGFNGSSAIFVAVFRSTT